MSFDPNILKKRLVTLGGSAMPSRWLIAFSGGVDSTVLLHAMSVLQSTTDIVAVHVNHGLQDDSDLWESHCRQVANDLGVGFIAKKVEVDESSESGPEAAARQARYAALLVLVEDGDCLMSGHHEDDQAETLLLNLMRGSGPAGLAGIGAAQSFGRGQLWRPMLGINGDEIRAYAEENELRWIEDPSNVDTRFDRNFLRQEVMPLLASRWPAAANRLRRSANLVSEASELLNQLADIDLADCGAPSRLHLPAIRSLSPARQRNVLRRSVRLSGLPPPPATRLYQAVHELIPARVDAQPLVEWQGVELRRFRDEIFVLPAIHSIANGGISTIGPGEPTASLGGAMGALALVSHEKSGLAADVVAGGLEIRFRAGGEHIRIGEQGATRKLKKLLQEEGILPWMRDRIPLLYKGDELVAVGDLWLSAEHLDTTGYTVEWTGKPMLK
jgi:tRNA(Ile)-lysidine synthase